MRTDVIANLTYMEIIMHTHKLKQENTKLNLLIMYEFAKHLLNYSFVAMYKLSA